MSCFIYGNNKPIHRRTSTTTYTQTSRSVQSLNKFAAAVTYCRQSEPTWGVNNVSCCYHIIFNYILFTYCVSVNTLRLIYPGCDLATPEHDNHGYSAHTYNTPHKYGDHVMHSANDVMQECGRQGITLAGHQSPPYCSWIYVPPEWS